MQSKTVTLICHVEKLQNSTGWKTEFKGELDNDTIFIMTEALIDKLESSHSSKLLRIFNRLFERLM